MKKTLLLSALLIFACSSDSEGNPCIYEPTLSTEAVTNITETSATLNGIISILSENCEVAPGEMQGFVYSTNPTPTNDDNVEVVYGTDISTTIDNLIPNTTYYVRVFITNNLGDFYGNEMEFTTNEGCDVVYLDENGVTIKACPNANVGDVGIINGVEYTIVDRDMLDQMIENEQDVTKVCTTRITDMSDLFFNYNSFNLDIGNWDVSNVTDMHSMFHRATTFNQDISLWDVSNVTRIDYMFFNANSFNQPIDNWNVSSVYNLTSTFGLAISFNQPIGNWDVSSVIYMQSTFFSATAFNQDISLWDVSNVESASMMFYNASAFNQDISLWDVSNVNNMIRMFNDAISFNQDLSGWNVNNVSICNEFSNNTPQWTLPQPNFTNCNPN